MSADVDIETWLSSLGFGGAGRVLARRVLEEGGLTRPGKTRLSVEKHQRAAALLKDRFVLHCHSPACVDHAKATGRLPVVAETRQSCERCGGSENSRAAKQLIEAGIKRLVVVGGTPATREELERLLSADLELRLVDGTVHRPTERARADLEWADKVLLWGATELHHKVSKQYSDVTAFKHKVVHVPRRGIAQLLAAIAPA